MKVFLYRILCGFFLGISVFAPGFSGSIVAIAMGIYHDILRIISNPLKNLKQNLVFCFPVGIGVVISAVLFVLTFRYLFDTYEKATYLLFVGLIAGNIPIVYKEVRKIGFKPNYLFGALGAFAAALTLGVFVTEAGLISGDIASVSNWPGLAAGGIAAGVTALIPGMSISTILIILGVYSPLIYAAEALLRQEFSYFIPLGLFVLCTVVGLMSTARGIKHTFKRYPGFANTTVLGFLFGSLLSVMYRSHQITDPAFNWTLGGLMLAAGIGVSMLFIVLGRIMNKTE
jgi:putative membrane protein